MNLHQTPLKYIPAMNHTMSKQNSKSVSIAGSSDKRSITGTFAITLNGHLLPMLLIYGGGTKKSLPRFLDSFKLSCNPKHFSNAMESTKLINEIIIPYVQNKKKKTQRIMSTQRIRKYKQATLVITDIFQGQITDDAVSL